MTRWWRWALALLLCGLGAVLGPVPSATSAPIADAGVGRVVADLGPVVPGSAQPGFSFDGVFYAYLVPVGDRCDLHLYDLRARGSVDLVHNRVACDPRLVRWAGHAGSLQWQVAAAEGDVTAYVWDAGSRQVSVLAPDAHVFAVSGISGDGRFLAFTGRSDTHPAPSVDAPRSAGFLFDRGTGVSLPLSKPDLHLEFGRWGPTGHRFYAATGAPTQDDRTNGSCFGSGTSCQVSVDRRTFVGESWSRDGDAVVGELVTTLGDSVVVHDFSDGSTTGFPPQLGSHVDFAIFIGPTSDRVLGYLQSGTAVWDRTSGRVQETADGPTYPSPTGRYLLVDANQPEVFRYWDLADGTNALAAYRGSPGYWTEDSSFFLGTGPGGCSSLRQWAPATNTVSLFGPPGSATCFAVPSRLAEGSRSSASGRFGLMQKQKPDGTGTRWYVADLRRHVLLGPLTGSAGPFAPAGSDVLVVRRPLATGGVELLLVDPTPTPDVDDKPRWSSATPASGARVEARVGTQVHVQLGASDLQGTPVNLYFRWRDERGTPIASAPKGWSCERRRLAAGATVADCTFAPPRDFTATRFLDVSATNYATGAQSDTRAYRVSVGT